MYTVPVCVLTLSISDANATKNFKSQCRNILFNSSQTALMSINFLVGDSYFMYVDEVGIVTTVLLM